MKKVLIPTDFSESAKNAFDYAVKLLGSEAYSFILMNSYASNSSGGGMLVSMDDVLEKEAVRDLKREVLLLKEKYGNIDLQIKTQVGTIEEAVRRVNVEGEIDYVIMGTHGASGLKKMFTGSNTLRVIENVVRPVIAVPDNYTFTSLKTIVFATDLMNIQDRATLFPLTQLADKYECKLIILHVTNKQNVDLQNERNRLELDELFTGIDHEYVVEQSENPVKGIHEYLKNNEVDMLALVPRATGFFEGLFKSSVTKELALNAELPLIALKDV